MIWLAPPVIAGLSWWIVGMAVVGGVSRIFKGGSRGPVKAKAARIISPNEYKPSNPRWLASIANTNPKDLPKVPEPPSLTAFRQQGTAAAGATVAGAGTSAAPAAGATGAAAAIRPGSAAAAAMFCLDPEWDYLNHGSYGATFRIAMEAQSWYREQLERQPVLYIETTALQGVVQAAAQVAELVGADWQDLVPVVNATSAVNAVVNSLRLAHGDLLLMCNTTYPAVRSTLARAAARSGASLLEVTIPVDDTLTNEGAVIAAFDDAIKVGRGRIRLAVVDHVISFPPVVMPVARLTKLLREAGIPVLVDGAHSLGALPRLNLPALGCQYYTANAHKWLCTPKGCAFLWVERPHQGGVLPPVTSHGYGLGFRGEFLWQGTSDPTAWLSVPACLAAMEKLGRLEKVAEHNHRLVREASELLRKRWGVSAPVLGVGACSHSTNSSDSSGSSRSSGVTAGLAAVQLPEPLYLPASGCNGSSGGSAAAASGAAACRQSAGQGARRLVGCTAEGAAMLQRHLRERHRIEVPVACVEGHLYCRISAQVYNSMPQYERLAQAVACLASSEIAG